MSALLLDFERFNQCPSENVVRFLKQHAYEMILLNVERTKAIGNTQNIIFVRKVARGRNSYNFVSVMM